MARRDAPPPQPERQKREARPDKIAAFRAGISAESRAAVFLMAKGFRIVARRWKSPAGEIDLIARRGRLLVFAEVKARAAG
jgi:putative endonuclease